MPTKPQNMKPRFAFKTTQVGTLLYLFETLNYLTNQLIIEVESRPGKRGVCMIASKYYENSINSVAYVWLEGDKFEEFECTVPTRVTLSLVDTYKMIKSSRNNSELSIECFNEDKLWISFYNTERRSKSEFCVNLLVNDDAQFRFPSYTYVHYIMLQSYDLFSALKDMSSTSKYVTFHIEEGKIQLITKSMGVERTDTLDTTHVPETDPESKFIITSDEFDTVEYTATFPLLAIHKIHKAQKLNKILSLYINDQNPELPLVMLFQISNLGQLRYMLGSVPEHIVNATAV